VFTALGAAGDLPAHATPDWIADVLAHCPDDTARATVRALAVEPPRALFGASHTSVDVRFAENVLSRLLELDAVRRLSEAKSRLQRLNPLDSEAEYRRLFADVLALEQYRRELREYLVGQA
jgi:DNA primase